MSLAELEKFDELFEGLNDFNPHKIENFVHTTLATFELIREKIGSSSPEDRKEALELASGLQKKFEFFTEQTREKNGLTSSEIEEFSSSSHNFESEEWDTLKKSEQQIEDYTETLKQSSSREVKRKSLRQRV